jgi:transposase-like protein
VVNVRALVATGVNADGHREILGVQVTSAEDGAGWLSFFRDLTARGLSRVALVTSDARSGFGFARMSCSGRALLGSERDQLGVGGIRQPRGHRAFTEPS